MGEGIAIPYAEVVKRVPAKEKPLGMNRREQVVDMRKPRRMPYSPLDFFLPAPSQLEILRPTLNSNVTIIAFGTYPNTSKGSEGSGSFSAFDSQPTLLYEAQPQPRGESFGLLAAAGRDPSRVFVARMATHGTRADVR